MSDRGKTIYDWTMARLDEGMTVYFATPLRVIEVKPKHRDLVRLNGSHCEVSQGRRWDSVNYTKVTAS